MLKYPAQHVRHKDRARSKMSTALTAETCRMAADMIITVIDKCDKKILTGITGWLAGCCRKVSGGAVGVWLSGLLAGCGDCCLVIS